jgi:L-serine kinase (ADP)
MKVLKISDLLAHEKVDDAHLSNLCKQISSDRVLKKPILVDENTNIVLDGHHRLEALRVLGYTKIPAQTVDYLGPEVAVESMRDGYEVNKKKVIAAGKTSKLFPPKTSRHLYDRGSVVNMPLNRLK